jgi:rhamnosyltransferase
MGRGAARRVALAMENAREGSRRAGLVSIIILAKNGEKTIRSLLDGLCSQKMFERSEVIVIDSGSSDGTLDIVSKFPVTLTQIPPGEFGHGRTRNLGARLARGEFLVYVPQDATPVGPDWLGSLLLPFEDPAVAGVYCRQVPRPDASAMESCFLLRTYTQRFEVRKLVRREDASLSACFFSTVGGAVRASLWQEYPFREDVIMSEDQAWSKEVMLAGHLIAYQPAAELLHSHQYGIVDIFRRNFDSGFSIQQIFSGRTGISAMQGLSRLAREAAFVLRTRRFMDILRFPFYECARHFGFWAGMHAEFLPVSLRKACGNLGYFWDRTPASRGENK